jgi:hypothetical protein
MFLGYKLNVSQLSLNLDLSWDERIQHYYEICISPPYIKKGCHLLAAFRIQNTHKYTNHNSTQKQNIQPEHTCPTHNYCQCCLHS